MPFSKNPSCVLALILTAELSEAALEVSGPSSFVGVGGARAVVDALAVFGVALKLASMAVNVRVCSGPSRNRETIVCDYQQLRHGAGGENAVLVSYT